MRQGLQVWVRYKFSDLNHIESFREKYKPEIPNQQYMICPIDSGHDNISEGYIYSHAERGLHGNFFHKSIDYETQYGTPVRAAADGIAVAFYHRFVVLDQFGVPRLYHNLPLGNGLGYAVQIYHPEEICGVQGGRYTQYGHLAGFSDKIKQSCLIKKPLEVDLVKSLHTEHSGKVSDQRLGELIEICQQVNKTYPWTTKEYGYSSSPDWRERESYLWTPQQLQTLYEEASPYVKLVKQGEIIGYVGESALFWGNADYHEGIVPEGKIAQKDPAQSWDEIHLHFEEFTRKLPTPEALVSYKSKNRDPYDIYKGFRNYKSGNWGKDHLFIN